MTYKTTLKMTLCAGAIIVLTACAATPDTSAAKSAEAATAKTTEAVVYAEPQNDKEAAILAANDLSATKNVTTSADGKIKCKRQAVVGSNFKRKICMTQAQWDQMAEENRKTTGDIQRRKAPGTGN